MISGFVKMPISAGTNWKGGRIEDKKTDIFSGPQNKNKNSTKITRENAMRILTGFNVSYLYME